MNFAQKLGIFCLILITAAYIYFSFFNQGGFSFNNSDLPELPSGNIGEIEPAEKPDKQDEVLTKKIVQVKIFVTDSNGNLRSVIRKCNQETEKSCFAFAIKELVSAPTKWEREKGLSSEIPSNTRILSVREGADTILIDLSPEFESGGGAESTYIRVHQLIKTALANTKLPVYLYINGKQADVIGGEGVMIKQPLSERSFND